MKKNRNILIICIALAISGCGNESGLSRAGRHAALAQKNFMAAVRIYEKQLALAPESSQIRYSLARLYYEHGDFESAIKYLQSATGTESLKLLAKALYRSGDYTAALEACKLQDKKDDESLYYEGLISERLNLFDPALKAYRSIKGAVFASAAQGRLAIIEKAVNPARIRDIDPEVARLIDQSPSPESYPQAGALVLLSDESVEITGDNKAVYNMHYVVRILNQRGKETFSEAPVEYDSTDEKVELEYARTIRPDGTVVDVGSRHIRDVSKYLNFPLYSNARVYIISFPAVAEGATVEYKIKLFRSELVNKKDFVIPMPLQMSEPVIRGAFSLTMPEGRTLNIKSINERYNTFAADLAPKVSADKGKKTYKWDFKDIPQIIPEPEMPPAQEINPSVMMSSFGSWQEIHDWWLALAKDKIKPDAAIKDKVAELIRGLDSKEAAIRAIYNFCAQKVRYVAVEYGQAGYEPHKAEDIFRNKYGDCKDQAILLVTMLREAGFGAWPVLIPTRDSFDMDPQFPSMLFNHCIAAVLWNNELVFMDPTAETCSFGDLPAGDQGRNVLVVRDDKFIIARTPIFPADSNTIKNKLSLVCRPDGSVSGVREISSSGVYDQAQRYWLIYTVPDVVKDKISSKIQEISIGGELEGYNVTNLEDLNNPLVLRYSFHGPEFFTEAGLLRIAPAMASVDFGAIAKPQRAYPISYRMLDRRDIETTLALPEGYAIKYLPRRVDMSNQWMKFKAEYSVKNNVLKFVQSSQLLKRDVSVEEYPAYKQALEQLAKSLKQRVVLERAK